jgi:DNA-binding LytR/AlgR family response regulator
MKLTINADDRYAETEIIVNCSHMGDDIEKLLAAIRVLDMKITGRKDGREYILEMADIIYIESIDKRTFLYTLKDTYESAFRLYELETKLVPLDFLRASRNCLINVNHIQSIETEFNSRLILTMPREIKLIVSRQYAAEVKQKLEAYHV